MLERKILTYIQFRKGSNKVGILGMLQLFSDKLKLLLSYKYAYYTHIIRILYAYIIT